MDNSKVIVALKDEKFRENLSDRERSLLPDHPAGEIVLGDSELELLAGGYTTGTGSGICPCPGVTVTGSGMPECYCVCISDDSK